MVKRYEIVGNWNPSEDSNGPYTTHADYKALENECTLLANANVKLASENAKKDARIAVLLQRAIDEMHKNAELTADADRLEWITENDHMHVMGNDERGWSVADCSNGLTFAARGYKTMREAIDHARQENDDE
jgi:hypothetical protein